MVQRPRCWVIAIAIAIAAVGRPAAAQGLVVQADGSVNVGYTETTQPTPTIDPNAQASDKPAGSVGSFITELRPAISLQAGSPRLTWRVGYLFSSAFSIASTQSVGYSNQANAALAAELTKFSLMTVTGSAAQGGTSSLLSQQPADAGKPAIRAPGNPDLVSGTLVESFSWQPTQLLSVQHSLIGVASAPQNDLHDRNSAVTGTLSLDRLWGRDTVGMEAHASVSWLRPLEAQLAPYKTTANAILGRWNHDISWQWNGFVAAGVEQVFSDTGNRPLALLPTGRAIVRYTAGSTVGGLEYSHGSATNLQVGTVSLTDQVTARGIITLNAEKARVLSFSGGFLHNEPLGQASVLVAAASGDAVQGDAGFTMAIAKDILGTARYSLAYQFGQGGGFEPTLVHIFLIGVTARYSNTSKVTRPVPKLGQRVDGSDGEGFPTSDDTEPNQPNQLNQTNQPK